MEDIIKEIEFNNEKNILINKIDEWLNLTEDKKEKNLIKNELEIKEENFLENKEYYKNLIFFSKSENVLNEIDLEIIFCNGDNKLIDIWRYFKVMSSSAVTGDDSFGCIKIMIKDKNTNKYIGILEIGNDIYSCGERDKFIGWTKDNKNEKVKINDEISKSRISYIINITCCIGLQPMSYNLNIGKLLVMTVFSKEVMDYFYKKRGYYYAGVTTFGLYGKSIQYDRLKEIKFIGETTGNGTCDIPGNIYENIRDFYKKYFFNEYYKCSKMSSSKMRILQYGLRILGYDNNVLHHGKKRGIYFGYTSNQSKDFLNGKTNEFKISNNILPFNNIIENWKNRWAKQRLNHLLLSNRFKVCFDLKNFTLKEKKNEYMKQYKYEKLDDEVWLKNKKEKSKLYYQNNKDSILKLLEKDLINYRCEDLFLDPEYVAGFFDSDGSVYISNKNVLCISFTQCVLNILLLLQKQYGGELFERNGKNIKQRKQYTLRIIGLECKKIIEDLNKYSVLKINKIENALTYLDFINKKNCESKLELIDFIRNNNKIDDTKYFSRINWKYIAGMFDGDGYIGLNYKYLEINKISIQFSICQKYTPNFLGYLKNFMSSETNNFFSLSKNDIRTSKFDNIIKIYNFIKQYIIVKKYQYDKMIELLNEYNKDNVNFVKVKEIGYLIKNNKHQHIEYEIDLNKENIITSMKQEILLDIENNITEETKKQNLKEIQSDKKTGINNPNYGHQLSDTHALNISISTTISKRSKNENLTNEKIREIYGLKDTELQKNVAEKYNMNREIIRRIWNKIILPTDDPDFLQSKIDKTSTIKKEETQNNNLTFEQKTSIGKRTLNIDEYIIILEWKIKYNNKELLENKKISTPKLAEYLSKSLNKKITTDIIKNVWCGKTKIYDFEFIDKSISYEDYIKLTNKNIE
jgi:hypothetical protein